MVNDPEGSTRVIHPGDIKEDGFIKSSAPPVQTSVMPRRPLEKGEILLQNKGRFVAAVFSMPEGECWITPASVLILTLKTKKILPEYIALYLNSTKGQRQLNSVKELSSVPFITRPNLEKINISIPPIKKQEKLIKLNNAISMYKNLTKQKTEILIKIMNSELES
ncbi:MAG: restriction endonuclease subunit S [Candidatus Sabulitectum sp.]|nr:restriction endonuclease subunit S [Candidatus Sabulitectum sp.]